MSRRGKHMLAGIVARDYREAHERLPSSKQLALVAGIHPATARRWLADLRGVVDLKASALRK